MLLSYQEYRITLNDKGMKHVNMRLQQVQRTLSCNTKKLSHSLRAEWVTARKDERLLGKAMPEIQLSPLEKKLEMLFRQHDIALPRNLSASLCGLIAGEVTQATCGGYPNIRGIKLPPHPQDFEGEVQSRKGGSHV